jgi:hypothetical protein
MSPKPPHTSFTVSPGVPCDAIQDGLVHTQEDRLLYTHQESGWRIRERRSTYQQASAAVHVVTLSASMRKGMRVFALVAAVFAALQPQLAMAATDGSVEGVNQLTDANFKSSVASGVWYVAIPS